MSRLLLIGAVAVPIVTTLSFAWAATNLNSSRSNIYREFPGTVLVSASTPLSAAHVAQTVYTTSATGDFVLTQFCASPVSGGTRLAAVGLGGIAHTADTLCYTFQPGVIMPKGAAITCTTTEFAGLSGFCMITGLLRP
jgi:hypothetical protein